MRKNLLLSRYTIASFVVFMVFITAYMLGAYMEGVRNESLRVKYVYMGANPRARADSIRRPEPPGPGVPPAHLEGGAQGHSHCEFSKWRGQ